MIAFGLFLAFCAGIGATLWFQASETNGRLHAHGRAYKQAWDKADEWERKAVALQFRLDNERAENAKAQFVHETWWAEMAAAKDKLVQERDRLMEALLSSGEHTTRVKTLLAMDSAMKELHKDPSPRCPTCGECVGQPDPRCFPCALHDEEIPPALRIVAQA
jgi:hypothetical protein